MLQENFTQPSTVSEQSHKTNLLDKASERAALENF